MHDLWTTLDTSCVRRPMKKQSLKAYFRRSNYTLTRAIIHTRASFDNSQMRYLTKTCKKLKVLQMCGSGIIGSSLMDALHDAHNLESLTVSRNCEMSSRHVHNAMVICQKSLVDVSFQSVKGMLHGDVQHGKLEALKSIELRSSEGKQIFIVSSPANRGLSSCNTINWKQNILIECTPNVERVVLEGWSCIPVLPDLVGWACLESLTLSDMNLQLLPKLPATLKHLHLNDNYHLGIEDGDVFELPQLETLNVHGCLNLSSAAIIALTKECIKTGNLKCLEVGGRLHDSRISADTQYPSSESLEALRFDSMIVGDKDIMAVVDLYPNLRRLDIHGTKVTGVGMRYLFDRGLTYVNVKFCEELGEDAVIWARAKGVEVEWKPGAPGIIGRAFRTSRADVY